MTGPGTSLSGTLNWPPVLSVRDIDTTFSEMRPLPNAAAGVSAHRVLAEINELI